MFATKQLRVKVCGTRDIQGSFFGLFFLTGKYSGLRVIVNIGAQTLAPFLSRCTMHLNGPFSRQQGLSVMVFLCEPRLILGLRIRQRSKTEATQSSSRRRY